VEARRIYDLGMVLLRSRAQPGLLRLRESRNLELQPTAGRQQMVDDHLRARCNARWVYQMTPHDEWDYDSVSMR
jgi:hypothetical protein